MHLGDYIHKYGAGQYGTARTPQPATECLTLSDYRTRHAQYKLDAQSQEMHRQHPMVAIWDDHETANNSWVGGAENHQPEEGDWNARVTAALQAYCEWMPVRIVDRWHLDTVASVSSNEAFAVAFQTTFGSNRLSPATQTTPVPNPPTLAP